MRLLFRILAMFVVVPATYFFIFWVPFSFIPFEEQRWIPAIISLLCAIGIGSYVWRKLASTPDDLVTSILLGAVIVGGIGFCGGFFGPMIFKPEANQGPLMGIFITGPLGFLLGAVGGLFYGLAHRK